MSAAGGACGCADADADAMPLPDRGLEARGQFESRTAGPISERVTPISHDDRHTLRLAQERIQRRPRGEHIAGVAETSGANPERMDALAPWTWKVEPDMTMTTPPARKVEVDSVESPIGGNPLQVFELEER